MSAKIAAAGVRWGVLVGLAATGLAIAGASQASADGLSCQHGCTVDYDGTAGSFDQDGTNGDSRTGTPINSTSHQIVSDTCFLKGESCAQGLNDPSNIGETENFADDADSALDADGFQADHTSGPLVSAVPGTTAFSGTTATGTGGVYYPH